MPFMHEALSTEDQEVIRRCLRAAVEGPFFEDREFATLFGLDRADVEAVLARWPSITNTDAVARLAINNAIANLLGYPHGHDLRHYLGVDSVDLDRVFERWRAAFSEPRAS